MKEKNHAKFKKIITDYCFDHNWKCSCNDEKETIRFNVPLLDNSEQICIASIIPSFYGNLIEIVSEIGEYNEQIHTKYLTELLQTNQTMVYARTQIDPIRTKFTVVARTLASSTLEEEIELMIKEIAWYASKLKQKMN